MAKFFVLRDDFVAPIVDNANARVHSARPWTLGGSGIGTVAIQSSTSGTPGILRIPTTANTNDNARMHTGSGTAGIFIPDDLAVLKFRVRIPTTVASMRVRFGLGEDLSAASFGTHGLFFQYDSGVSASWQAISRLASTSTTVTTPESATANEWISGEFVRSSGALWHAYITNAGIRFYAGSLATNLPTTQAMPLGVYIETLTTAARNIDVDLIELSTKELTLR